MFKNIIKKILIENIEIEEGGFPRVRRIMLSDVDSINSLGIMTAENPNATPISGSENEKLNKKFKQHLRSFGYGFIEIDGDYGVKENSVLIPNVSKGDLIQLGYHYEQESVIYGQKKVRGGIIYFEFELLINGQPSKIRNISLSGSEIQSQDEFFSAIKNRKFIIPFFDEKYEFKDPSKINGKILKDIKYKLPDSSTLEKFKNKLINKTITVKKDNNYMIVVPDNITIEDEKVTIYSNRVEISDTTATKIYLLEKFVDYFRDYFNMNVVLKTNEFIYPK
jgi:hypothetical protein